MRHSGRKPVRTRGRLRRAGFTLAEVALTVVIVGTGVLATVRLFATCTQQTRESSDMTTAMFLANNIQEAVANLPFSDPSGSTNVGLEETAAPVTLWNDIDDFTGKSFSPPLDANRLPIAGLEKFTQEITVQRVDPQRLSVAATGSDAARVTVRILYKHRDGTQAELHRLTWVRVRS